MPEFLKQPDNSERPAGRRLPLNRLDEAYEANVKLREQRKAKLAELRRILPRPVCR